MKKQNKKKIIITVTAVVLVVAIGLGVWFGVSRGRSEPVKVFAFNSVGMTEYWGDSQESYGPVSTDKIQTVFLSSTQTVTESYDHAYDGSESGKALICWLRLTTNANGDRVTPTVDDALLEEARQRAEKFQNENQPDPTEPSTEPTTESTTE